MKILIRGMISQFRIVCRFLSQLANSLLFRYSGVLYGTFCINGIVRISNAGYMLVGDGFMCNSGHNYNLIGGDRKCSFVVLPHAELAIGKNVGISNSTIVCSTGVTIQDGVLIGGGCRVWDTDFHSVNPYTRTSGCDTSVKSSPILICERAFIGGGSIILKGVTIGENSIVAAGSVVTKSIPPNEIWGGNPARYIRALTSEELRQPNK